MVAHSCLTFVQDETLSNRRATKGRVAISKGRVFFTKGLTVCSEKRGFFITQKGGFSYSNAMSGCLTRCGTPVNAIFISIMSKIFLPLFV